MRREASNFWMARRQSVKATYPEARRRSRFHSHPRIPYADCARYLGDSVNPPSTSNPVTVTVNAVKQITNTNLTASSASIQSGQSLTLTASVTPSGATGTVTFTDGSTPLGQAQLNNGIATLTTSSLSTVGSHSLTASYPGDTNFNGSSGSTTVSVTTAGNLTTTTTLSVDPLTANAGQAVIMGAGVTGPSGAGTVTGSVTFTDNGISTGYGSAHWRLCELSDH